MFSWERVLFLSELFESKGRWEKERKRLTSVIGITEIVHVIAHCGIVETDTFPGTVTFANDILYFYSIYLNLDLDSFFDKVDLLYEN